MKHYDRDHPDYSEQYLASTDIKYEALRPDHCSLFKRTHNKYYTSIAIY